MKALPSSASLCSLCSFKLLVLLVLLIAAAGCASGGFGGHGLVIAVRAFDQSADDSSPALAADLFVIPLVDWNKHRLQDAWLRLGEGDAQRAQFLESIRKYRYERSRTPVKIEVEPKQYVFVLVRDGKFGLERVTGPSAHKSEMVILLR